ncbi:MAG: ATP-dependent DNA helicase RecG [Bacteroidota bacterium]
MIQYSFFQTPIEYLKGVGQARAEVLRKELNIYTFSDLLTHYPFRYIDKTKFNKINEITDDSNWVQIKGTIEWVGEMGEKGGRRFIAKLTDNTGEIELVWFKGIKWVKDKVKIGVEYTIYGKPSVFNNKFNFVHPEIEVTSENITVQTVKYYPFYSSTEKAKALGLDSKGISRLTFTLLSLSSGNVPENIPERIREEFHIIDREIALKQIHFPDHFDMLSKAVSRLKFEELFFIQIQLFKSKYIRIQKNKGFVFSLVGAYFNTFYSKYLPFELTGAQKRVIKEIRADMGSGKQMNRLLQGDVGSGKTLVALMCMLIAMDNNFQVCLMVPTEILAQQHFNTLTKFLDGMGIAIDLLTGSVKGKKRKKLLEGIQSGEINILIGTHALIEDTVQFKSLGLVVIDEQHRFGVAQRAKMWTKSEVFPHVLVMTATPIPRTLAMTVYGDLDISVIDELPPGRKAIKTLHYFDNSRLKVLGFIRSQIQLGRQVYIVYPLIEESEKLDLLHLQEGYESLSRDFPLPQYAISMVHGKLSTEIKEFEMQRFIRKETQIMVATTVIEVGVDVPNATIMIVENAERFGLSQLHQLRGRVGRGSEQSYCILMSSYKLTAEGKKRLETLVQTSNGFEVAEVDLQLRGPGDMSGLMQSGMVNLKIANLVKDEKMIKLARDVASKVIDNDPELEKSENNVIAWHLKEVEKTSGNWSSIS